MSFLTCQLDSNSIEFLVCDKNLSNKRKVIFRKFSPTPDAPVFYPNSSYYFICKCFFLNVFKFLATSNGTLNGLKNTQFGFCATKNMRLKIEFTTTVNCNFFFNFKFFSNKRT